VGAACIPDPYGVTVVGVESAGADVPPPVAGVGGPKWCVAGLFVGEKTSTRRSQRSAVVIRETVELGVGQELWIKVGALKKIDGDESLWKKAVPEVNGEVFVGTSEAGDGMIICERANGALGGIATMEVGRYELEVDTFGAQNFF
jgi:hypothetical protein